MSSSRRVKLLIDTSSSWGRDIIRGISAYAKEHGPWTIDLDYQGRYETPHLPPDWPGDGVIARVTSPRVAQEIIRRGLPAVNVSWYSYGSPQIPRCTNNETTFGRLMAEYLIRRGLRSFAYFGVSRRQRPGYADRVREAFADVLAKSGFTCAVWSEAIRTSDATTCAEVARWLSDLPRPVGIAVWGDQIGRQVADACNAAGIGIPDGAAIISAEYDMVMNSLAPPPLTTVDYLADEVGYQAAALLDRMLDGQPPPPQGVVLEPLGVITRQSTENMAVEDPLVATALGLIRQNLRRPVRVSHLLKELGVARRGLEQRFRKALGRGIAEEIRRVHLDRAMRMLRDSPEPVQAIAKACGFHHPEVLTRSFRRHFGLSPSDFRRQHRLREA